MAGRRDQRESRREGAGRRGGEPLAGAAQDERAFERGAPGDRPGQSGFAPAAGLEGDARSGQAGQPPPDHGELLAGQLLRDPDHAGEQEEGEAGGKEGVADRGDVLEEGQGDRDHVSERAKVEQERGVQGGRQHRVNRGRDVLGPEPGHGEARLPDRHVAAVDHDDDRVGQDPDEREVQAREGAVDPERDEQEPERAAEQGQAERLDDRDLAPSRASVP